HTPSFVTPIGTTSNSSCSTAAMTCSADTTETSCSADLPPKMRPRRITAPPRAPKATSSMQQATGEELSLLLVACCLLLRSIESFSDERNFGLELHAKLLADPPLREQFEGKDVGRPGIACVDHEVAVLLAEFRPTDPVAPQPDGLDQLPGRLPGWILEEGPRVAAARLRRQPALVVILHSYSQLGRVARPQRHFGP